MIVGYFDSTLRFYRTRDGKNYEKIVVGKDTAQATKAPYIYIDPYDADHWLGVVGNSGGSASAAVLLQSFDAGRNWQSVDVPVIPAERSYIEVSYDNRRAQQWYVRVIAIQHHTSTEDTAYVVRTTDNGQTFVRVPYWGKYFGIGDSEEARLWVSNSYNTIAQTVVGGENNGVIDTTELLQRFHPDLPSGPFAAGYYRSLSYVKIEYNGHGSFYTYYPSNHNVLIGDPRNASTVEYELRFDPKTNIQKQITTWVYATSDDWLTFDTLWRNVQGYWVDQTFLDQSTNTLYAVVNEFPTDSLTSRANRFRGFLYRYVMKNQSQVKSAESERPQLCVFPTPTSYSLHVQYQNLGGSIEALSMLDLFGHVRASTNSEFHYDHAAISWNVPSELPPGIYFLRVRTTVGEYFIKVILMR
jgi:hypothetical protein